MRGLTNASVGGIIEIGEITTDDKSQDPNYIKLDGHLIDLKDVDDNSIIHTFEKVLGKYESTNLSSEVLSSFYFKDTGLYIVVCTGLPMRLYKSTDVYNWTEISGVYPNACYFYDNVLYVITYNALYKINRNGVAVRIKNISEISANCIQVDGDDVGILAVNYNNSSITAYSTTLSSSTNTQRQYWDSCDSFNSGFVKSINKGVIVVCNSITGLTNSCFYSTDCGITYKRIEQPYVSPAKGNFIDCCPTSDGIIICNCYIGSGTEITPRVLLLKYNDNVYNVLYPISGYMGVSQYMNGCLISSIKDDKDVIYNINDTITATLCSYNANGINGGIHQGFAKVHSASSANHRLKLLQNNICNHMIIMGQYKTPIYAKAPKYPYDAYMKIK